MRRILLAGAFTLACITPASGAAESLPMVGLVVLSPATQADFAAQAHPLQRAFVEAMAERGWVEGRTIRYAWRSAAGGPAREAAAVAELLQAPVDLLVAPGPTANAAVERTKTVPIVGVEFDSALVASLSRPGGNLTGIVRMRNSAEVIEQRTKLLSFASEITGAKRIARVVPSDGGERAPPIHPDTVAQARGLGITLDSVGLLPPAEIEHAVADARRRGVGALVVTNFPHWNDDNALAFAQAARRHRLPVVGEPIFNARMPGVLVATYGVDLREIFRRAAYHVDRILRGSKPADLPVENLASNRLTVYPGNAKALGLALPPATLVRADEVIP